MNVVMQLEAADALEWALFVAMHLPEPAARQAVVRGLVDRHAPACADMSPRQHAFLASMNVPRAWVAASLATWAAYAGDPAGVVMIEHVSLYIPMLSTCVESQPGSQTKFASYSQQGTGRRHMRCV